MVFLGSVLRNDFWLVYPQSKYFDMVRFHHPTAGPSAVVDATYACVDVCPRALNKLQSLISPVKKVGNKSPTGIFPRISFDRVKTQTDH